MTVLRLILRSLLHFRRSHFGVAAGMTVAAAVLIGALLVGDSVRASLLARSLQRIGRVDASLGGTDRMLTLQGIERMAAELGADTRLAPVLRLDGVASAEGGKRRANGLAVHGVEASFFAMAPGEPLDSTKAAPAPGEAYLAGRVASQLGVAVGDEILLRVEEPSALSRDMLLTPTEDSTASARVKVAAIVGPEQFERFALVATPLAPGNVFVDLGWLQDKLDLAGRVNLVLLDGPDEEPSERIARADAALAAAWRLDDLELELIECRDPAFRELRTPRVFLEDAIATAAKSAEVPTMAVATYFVNALRSGEGSTPYSMVTAVGPWVGPTFDEYRELVAEPGGAVITSWLAEDLAVAAESLNDTAPELELEYYVPGADRRLRIETSQHAIRRVVPLAGAAADPGWMPEFPGLEDSENCRDWDTGVPVDLDAIRDKDETYWDDHKGTPKAFVNLDEAMERWGSRFGSLTALRIPAEGAEDFEAGLREHLDPRSLGLYFLDVRGPALARGNTPTDFGGLFIGLSFFLIAAALLLVVLLFGLGVEQRSREVGLLLAVGFPAARVRRLLLGEAFGIALVGVLIGAPLGVMYTRALVAGLGSDWAGAVAGTEISFHMSWISLAIGAVSALVTGLGAAWFVLRNKASRPAAELLRAQAGIAPEPEPGAPSRRAWIVAGVAAVGAVALFVLAPEGTGSQAAGLFFGAGSLALIALLSLARVWLAATGSAATEGLNTSMGLGSRNAGRRGGRSLATVALLASGAFLVLSIGVHHKGGVDDPLQRDSGTGGFALYGSSTLPIHDELNQFEGRDALALDEEALEGVSFVPLRVRAGDDASCLNLGAPQNPRLVGVRAEQLVERGAFAFAAVTSSLELADGESPWTLLGEALPDGSVPAIADAASVQWTLKKSLGDTIEYQDGRGETFQVRLVATLSDSILQGDVLIAEAEFQRRYPGEAGFRGLLVDAPAEGTEVASEELVRGLSDAGLELTPSADRLQQFRAVQNTYLAIFQVLGALGVLLGSVGLGAIVLRNALERRSELSLLRAVGWRASQVYGLLFSEHVLLLLVGLGAGGLASWIAVGPARSEGAGGGLLLLAVALVVNGLCWVALASVAAVRGSILSGLRNE